MERTLFIMTSLLLLDVLFHFPQNRAADLAAGSFGHDINKGDLPGILVRCCMGFDVVLDLFDQRIGGLGIFGQHDKCLDHLTADRIRCTDNGTFQNIGQLHDDRFDFKRSDTVAAGLDQIIPSADVPEVSILIFPCGISGVIDAVFPTFMGLFLILC